MLNILAAVSIEAPKLHPTSDFLPWLSNSLFYGLVVTLFILYFARKSTVKLESIPGKSQNLFEVIVEAIYGQLEAIVGPKVAKTSFPVIATIFLFIVTSNWFGLLPGVGTIGWANGEHGGQYHGFLSVTNPESPLIRPATADLNMTLAIAVFFMYFWFKISAQETGAGFIAHMFTPKGKFKGFMLLIMWAISIFVGLIEIVSIGFRPGSLSLRLFGNIYAGENLLHSMSTLGEGFGPVGGFIASVLFPIPFYFLEILIGLLQGLVFALLCAIYLKLSTDHGDEHHDDEHAAHGEGNTAH